MPSLAVFIYFDILFFFWL